MPKDKKKQMPIRRKKFSSRLMKEKMKEDPLVENLNKISTFFRHHSQTLTAALIVAVILFIGGRAFLTYREKQNIETERLLAQAQGYMSGHNWDQAESTIDKIIQNHGSSNAAKEAAIMKPSVDFYQGNYAEAITQYENLLKKHGGETALELKFSLANAYQSKGDTEKALKLYDQLAADEDFSRMNELLYLKGRVLEAKNRYKEAVESYESIPKDPDSEFYKLGKDRLEWIRAMGDIAAD